MTWKPPDEYRTVVDVVERQTEVRRDSPLVYSGEEMYTYREIHDRARAVAAELRRQGIQKGDKVCTFLGNSPDYLAIWFGIAKAGAIMVPLNVDFHGDILSFIIENCEAETIVLEEATRQNYETVRENVGIEQEYLLSETGRAGYDPVDTLYETDRTPPDVDLSESDPMSIIYTSGTTGEPKGVVLPHFSYVNTGWMFATNVPDIDQTDRPFTTLPLSHCNAQQTTVMGSMLVGTDFVLERSFDPATFWDEIRAHDATVFNYIGTMIPNLYKQDDSPDDSEIPVEFGVGANAPAELIEDFEARFGVKLIEGYGLTETATVVTINSVDDRRAGSIGKPLPYTEVEVVDEEDRPLPPGEEGEIVVRPARPNAFMLTYYNKARETVDGWQNLWLHTGDIGYKDEDGFFYFVDRKDYAIQHRGETISSFEVENVLSDHPDVQDVAVFGVTNARGDEEVKAVVVPKADADLTPVDIADYCDGRLAYFKVPRFIEINDAVPKTATERIEKYKLKQDGIGDAWDRETGYELQR